MPSVRPFVLNKIHFLSFIILESWTIPCSLSFWKQKLSTSVRFRKEVELLICHWTVRLKFDRSRSTPLSRPEVYPGIAGFNSMILLFWLLLVKPHHLKVASSNWPFPEDILTGAFAHPNSCIKVFHISNGPSNSWCRCGASSPFNSHLP